MAQEEHLERLHYDGKRLPRGRHSLPANAVEAAHRERLVQAAIRVVAHQGYGSTSVADIVTSARVSRAAFYASFSSKEECFLAACYEGLGLMVTAIGERVAQAPPEPPEEVLRATIGGFLGFLADHPDHARCFLLDMPVAGEEARRRHLAVVDILADNTRRWHRRVIARRGSGRLLTTDVYRMLSGGIAHLCIAQVHAGRTETLPEFEEAVMGVHLAILTGQEPGPVEEPVDG